MCQRKVVEKLDSGCVQVGNPFLKVNAKQRSHRGQMADRIYTPVRPRMRKLCCDDQWARSGWDAQELAVRRSLLPPLHRQKTGQPRNEAGLAYE